MRACARVALASIAVSASFSLSGCAVIEELKETFLRWVESEKLPSGRGVSADELPEATPVVPPKKTPKEPSNRHPQPEDAARKLQRQIVVDPPGFCGGPTKQTEFPPAPPLPPVIVLKLLKVEPLPMNCTPIPPAPPDPPGA